jgi:DNA-binding IclR family transcriptional regulator
MADMPAASSEAIAARSGLNERYVREWLGAMVASGVVDYEPRDGTYALPREHAAFLTRAPTPANLRVLTTANRKPPLRTDAF